ncbi:MAG: NAD(P)H-dependent oxidoreductase subunit E, partial [Chloroflexi bacterium]|nr:NAD(P)H-dependent oxidoreductase subunit E [Chloroflexota bacterium]
MLDTILDRYAGRGREALLPVLWEVQTAYGHIDADAIHQISHTLRVPESDIYGVIEFYALFYSEPTGERIIRVCTDPSCGLAGADKVLDELCQRLNIHHGETTADGKFKVEHSPCLGMCE